MKLKIIKKKSKMNIILNVIIGVVLMSFGILLFDYQSVAIFNWIMSLVFFLAGLVDVISTLKNRKKDIEKTEEVLSWEEIK